MRPPQAHTTAMPTSRNPCAAAMAGLVCAHPMPRKALPSSKSHAPPPRGHCPTLRPGGRSLPAAGPSTAWLTTYHPSRRNEVGNRRRHRVTRVATDGSKHAARVEELAEHWPTHRTPTARPRCAARKNLCCWCSTRFKHVGVEPKDQALPRRLAWRGQSTAAPACTSSGTASATPSSAAAWSGVMPSVAGARVRRVGSAEWLSNPCG